MAGGSPRQGWWQLHICHTWGQRRQKWSKASVKTQYDPFQADWSTAFPVSLCSTDVQAPVCREAKPRPNRTNYVCALAAEPRMNTDTDTGMDLDENTSNLLTGIYTQETIWDIFLTWKRIQKIYTEILPTFATSQLPDVKLHWDYVTDLHHIILFCLFLHCNVSTGWHDIVSFWYRNSVSMELGWHFVLTLCYNRHPLTFHFVTATLFL